MVKRPQIIETSNATKGKLLCFLHYRYANSDDIVFTAKEIAGLIKGTNGRIISFALQELDNEQLVESESVKEESNIVQGYSITRAGIMTVESWDNDTYDRMSEGVNFLDESGATDSDSSLADGESRQEEEWEPLPLERSGEKYEAAATSVETALEEIEGNNGYASTEPEERNQIIWSIKNGLSQIRDGLPNREQVTTMLLKPLRYIARKFADASMGEAAKAAVSKLLIWLLS